MILAFNKVTSCLYRKFSMDLEHFPVFFLDMIQTKLSSCSFLDHPSGLHPPPPEKFHGPSHICSLRKNIVLLFSITFSQLSIPYIPQFPCHQIFTHQPLLTLTMDTCKPQKNKSEDRASAVRSEVHPFSPSTHCLSVPLWNVIVGDSIQHGSSVFCIHRYYSIPISTS